jgi:hypothetical protein
MGSLCTLYFVVKTAAGTHFFPGFILIALQLKYFGSTYTSIPKGGIRWYGALIWYTVHRSREIMFEQIIKAGKLNMDENKTNPARQAR